MALTKLENDLAKVYTMHILAVQKAKKTGDFDHEVMLSTHIIEQLMNGTIRAIAANREEFVPREFVDAIEELATMISLSEGE